MTTGGAGHEVVDHTSEIVVRLWAESFPELMAEGARAFADLVPEHLRRTRTSLARTLRIPADDRPRMLVGLLNELVFLAEAESWVPIAIEARNVKNQETEGGAAVVLDSEGAMLIEPFVKVKAATFHDLTVRELADGLEASVTLDV